MTAIIYHSSLGAFQMLQVLAYCPFNTSGPTSWFGEFFTMFPFLPPSDAAFIYLVSVFLLSSWSQLENYAEPILDTKLDLDSLSHQQYVPTDVRLY